MISSLGIDDRISLLILGAKSSARLELTCISKMYMGHIITTGTLSICTKLHDKTLLLLNGGHCNRIFSKDKYIKTVNRRAYMLYIDNILQGFNADGWH